MKTAKTLVSLEKSFSVPKNVFRLIVKNFHSEMSKGLLGHKSSLSMLPSFAGMPSGREKETMIALDLGGTNFRVIQAALDGRGGIKVTRESKFKLSEKDVTCDSKRLFGFIAGSVKQFTRQHKLSDDKEVRLGFTFSFPVEQTGIDSGILLRWNKGFSASGAVGKDIVGMFKSALEKEGVRNIRVAALVNDTVGTLAAGAYKDKTCDMGVILGTGTNACYPEKTSNIKKLKDTRCAGMMIINIEWGNFDKIHCTVYDADLDQHTNNPTRQRLEKMVSGFYLGEIVRLVLVDLSGKGVLFGGRVPKGLMKRYGFGSEYVSEIENDGSKTLSSTKKILNKFGAGKVSDKDAAMVKKVCRMVTKRSAHISAAAISAVVLWMDRRLKRKHTVAIDGTLFEKSPHYRKYLRAALKTILGGKSGKITLSLTKDGSGKGAAVLAALKTEV